MSLISLELFQQLLFLKTEDGKMYYSWKVWMQITETCTDGMCSTKDYAHVFRTCFFAVLVRCYNIRRRGILMQSLINKGWGGPI